MDGLAPRQHRDELLNPGDAGFLLFRRLDAPENRIPMGAIQRVEERLRLRVRVQRLLFRPGTIVVSVPYHLRRT